jgi:Na+/melibiose symporter-like transporter
VPTFFAGVIGGGFFRIGVGALPFLLPLMLQAGFGYSPLDSGLTTLATALGALSMKFGAERLINAFGFRRTLVWNSMFSALFAAVFMLFTPATPLALIFFVLLIGGFFRSLTFTAVNALTYADLDQSKMSQATGFAAVAQQLSLSIGIAIAATLLHIARGSGEATSSADFAIPFAVIGAIMLISVIEFASLSPEAGNALARRHVNVGTVERET